MTTQTTRGDRTRILRWAPRILAILYALFLSLFALDVFGVGYSFWETVVAFVMHQIPVFILLIGLALAWRWEWIGVLTYAGFALWYIFMWNPGGLSAILIVAGPAFLIALLFLADIFMTRRSHTAPAT